jgi:hypothetical protein
MPTIAIANRARQFGALLLVALALSLVLASELKHRQYDWDMLPYMAIALTDTGETIETAHDRVYDMIRNEVTPATYEDLTLNFDPQYRQSAAVDAHKFAESLPFYTVKPLYPALLSLLYLAGVDLTSAPGLLSGFGYVMSCLVVFAWIGRWLQPLLAASLTVIIALIPQVTAVAKLPTPDSLSLFLILLGFFIAIELRNAAAGLCVLIVAIAARPENIMYLGVLAVYLFLGGRNRIMVFCLAAIGALLFIFLRKHSGGYGWTTLFYFTFVSRSIDLPTFVSPLRLRDYLTIYRQELASQIFNPQEGLAVFVLAGFGAAAMKIRGGDFRDPYLHLVFLVLLLTISRILLLPGSFYRALLPCYLLAILALIHACIDRSKLLGRPVETA